MAYTGCCTPVFRITSYNVCYTKLLRLEVDGKKVDFPAKIDHVYLLFHKPVQVVTTASRNNFV